MGYIMSSFFISLYQLWKKRLEDYYKIKSKGNKYGKIVVQGGDNRLVGSVTIEGQRMQSYPCWQRQF